MNIIIHALSNAIAKWLAVLEIVYHKPIRDWRYAIWYFLTFLTYLPLVFLYCLIIEIRGGARK